MKKYECKMCGKETEFEEYCMSCDRFRDFSVAGILMILGYFGIIVLYSIITLIIKW